MTKSRSRKLRNIYALYKGENNLMDGTLEEISSRSGINIKTLIWMTNPSAMKRKRRNGRCLALIKGVS